MLNVLSGWGTSPVLKEQCSKASVVPFSVFRPAGKSLSDTALKRQQNQVNGNEVKKVATVGKH